MDRRSLARNILFILILAAMIALAFSYTVFFKILLVILGFGSIIFVHELGHFVAAKATGVRVHRFYLGFCPTLEIPEGFYRFLWIGPKFHFPGFQWQMKVFSFQRGETEYGIGLLPIGGFVHMAGEPGSEEESNGRKPEPRDFNAKPASSRAIILVAGAFMNAVFAFVFFIAAFMIGVHFVSPEIGQLQPVMQTITQDGKTAIVPGPAWEAGIEPGDRIVEVNGKDFREFQEIATEIALLSEQKPITVSVERPTQGGKPELHRFSVTPVLGPRGYQIGIAPRESLKVGKFTEGSPASKMNLDLGAVFVSVAFDNEITVFKDVSSIRETIKNRIGQTGRFKVKTPTNEIREIDIPIVAPSGEKEWRLGFMEGGALTVIGHRKIAPAHVKENFPEGSVIQDVSITDADGKRVIHRLYSEVTLEKLVEKAAGELEFTVIHEDQKKTVRTSHGEFISTYMSNLSLFSVPDKTGVLIGYIAPGSALQESSVMTGDKIVELNGRRVNGFIEAMNAIRNSGGKPMTLAYEEATTGTLRTIKVTPRRPEEGSLGILFEPEMFTMNVSGPLEACKLGMERTWLWGKRIFLIIRSLFIGTVEAKNLSGPVGIINIMYFITKYGFGKYLYILGLICINLAVVNLLPVPLLDGGHLVTIGIEKIIRRPVPLKYQAAAAWVGLILILSLLLFTTFWDIKRLIY